MITKDLIACCGLICTECFGYKGTISEAAKTLQREIETAKLEHYWHEIPSLGEYEPFKKSLDGLIAFRCPGGCRDGGGMPNCKIRICCRGKGFDGCWGCSDLETCDTLWEGAIKNLSKIKELGIDSYIEAKSHPE